MSTSYDAVPYTSYPYERTHPDRLATVGALFGVDPAPPRRARILELGCASGGNLLPMAEQLPEAELVGIDLSPAQVQVGQQAIAAARLSNVTLHAGDLRDIDEQWGQFDYVLCHGVMSWVPREVQDAILALMSARLTPQGIGIVSYNTYPGWYLRRAVREMMLYHVGQFEEPAKRGEQARALLDFVVTHGPAADAPTADDQAWGLLMRREAALLSRLPEDYLFHEHLEDHNTPFYFHEIEARLREAGLTYVADADVATMMTDPLPAAAAQELQAISPDLVRLEQYLDFVRGRQFRSSIVCREGITLDRDLTGARIVQRFVGWRGSERPTGPAVELTQGVSHTFDVAGVKVSSDQAITKAALQHLRARWPSPVAFSVLLGEARQTLAEAGIEPPDDADAMLAADVLRCYAGAALELRTEAPAFAEQAGSRPRVSPYTRWQAEHLDFVTSRKHVRVALDPVGRMVTRQLDGTRDREGLLEALSQRAAEGTLSVHDDDGQVSDPTKWKEPLSKVLDHTLRALGEAAVLLA